jgi:hypothetical protein
MSSLRHYAQIPTQTKYLICMNGAFSNAPNIYLTDASVQAVYISPGYVPKDFTPNIRINTNGVNSVRKSVYISPNSLFRDLGRQFYVMDSTGANQIALFREAQLVNGYATEGVSEMDSQNPSVAAGGYNTYWCKVWVSAPYTTNPTATVSFVRFG